MPRKKKVKDVQENKPAKGRVTREKLLALERAKQRVIDTGETQYIHQSSKWDDTFFVSPIDTHPYSTLIDQRDP